MATLPHPNTNLPPLKLFEFQTTALGRQVQPVKLKRFLWINSISLSTSNPCNSILSIFSLKPIESKYFSGVCSYRSYGKTGGFTKSLRRRWYSGISWCTLCNSVKKIAVMVTEAVAEDALLAAAHLRVRTFYEFKHSFRVEEHRKYRSQLEFEALKDRISGKLLGFQQVACVIATIPISELPDLTNDLCSLCKVIINGEERVVVGTLDLNQAIQLPDEIPGTRPPGIEAQFSRAYLTDVCVAKELQRKGIGGVLITQAVRIAHKWGMTDLYIHVAVDNDGARCLYEKMGFIYENDEPAWRARFLGRPRRFLLWANISHLLFRI